jgi:DNA-binding response OmpR family regulator
MYRVLVVDDDPDILDLISFNLSRAGFDCLLAADGASALDAIMRKPPDLVVLDIMLPGIGGLELLKRLKFDPMLRTVPVILLTARGEEVDRILGLELGADDYITKPFSVREMVLRAQRVVARTRTDEAARVLICDGIRLDVERFEVRVRGEEVRLTTTEFNLLAYLLRNRGRVISRDRLLEEVWGYRYAGNTRTVDTHIQRLRDKLGEEAGRIETVRGVGYKVEAAAGSKGTRDRTAEGRSGLQVVPIQ